MASFRKKVSGCLPGGHADLRWLPIRRQARQMANEMVVTQGRIGMLLPRRAGNAEVAGSQDSCGVPTATICPVFRPDLFAESPL
jgi:hypothetical protein